MDTDVQTKVDETGAPTDLTGGMPATETRVSTPALDADSFQRLAAIAGHLIPAAHGMPSAAEIVTEERLGFVLRSRPDLGDPLRAALRGELGDDVPARLDRLGSDEPTNLAALQLTIVSGYYTDRHVRDLVGYPGQMAIEVKSWLVPPYLEEGLIDAVLARGAVWRDPRTGERAVVTNVPTTYADRFTQAPDTPQGGTDGRDSA